MLRQCHAVLKDGVTVVMHVLAFSVSVLMVLGRRLAAVRSTQSQPASMLAHERPANCALRCSAMNEGMTADKLNKTPAMRITPSKTEGHQHLRTAARSQDDDANRNG